MILNEIKSLKNKLVTRRAFTLAEMMVVLMILSLVLAAFMPVITKRSKVSGSSAGIWKYASNNSDIFFGTSLSTQGLSLGLSGLDNNNTRLLINSSSADQVPITFYQGGTESGKLIVTGGTAGSTYGSYNVGLGEVTLPPASYGSATVVGYGAQGLTTSDTAVGIDAIANGSAAAVAVGDNAFAQGNRSIAMGSWSYANGTYAINIGTNTDFTHSTSYGAHNSGTVAIGTNATASGMRAVAIGVSTVASAYRGATAVGSNSTATASGSDEGASAFGYGAYANSIASTAIGFLTKATGSYSAALGYSANASGNSSTAVGNGAQATSSATTAVGSGANATKNYSVALGYQANATGSSSGYASAFGYTAKATGDYSTALSAYSVASGDQSCALGQGANASGYSGFAIGQDSKASNVYSFAIGHAATTNADNQIVLGTSAYTVYIPGKLTVDGLTTGPSQYWTVSDRRLKNLKGEFTDGLDKIRQIKSYNFVMKKDKEKIPQVGVIAQDLKKVFPEAVRKGDDGYLTIRQNDMFYAMLNSIKQLDKIVQGLIKDLKALVVKVEQIEHQILSLAKIDQGQNQRIKALEAKNKALEIRILKLEKSINK